MTAQKMWCFNTIVFPGYQVPGNTCIIVHEMSGSKNLLTCVALSVALLSCSVTPVVTPVEEVCGTALFSVQGGFPGARRGRCTIHSASMVSLQVLREDEMVTNPSPWYAFKLIPREPTTAIVDVSFDDWEQRYYPKMSTDGTNWRPVEEQHFRFSKDGSGFRLTLPLRSETVWLAAQELLGDDYYESWYRELAGNGSVEVIDFGRSREGRSLISVGNTTNARDLVLLTGRQHPPEVTGAIAMRTFTDTVLSDTDLARRFGERYRLIAIPQLNPDGVAGGNWRHNSGGTDLNRDWGPFKQPETMAIAKLLDDLDAAGYTLRLFVDFHSTKKNLFYTQAPEDVTSPPQFTETWLERARARLDNYSFAYEPRSLSDTPNSKNYMYKRYGAPSITYEVGDETRRSHITRSAQVFAEEMMRLLLEQ